MHECPNCGYECDCHGDIDDISVMNDSWVFTNCNCCDGSDYDDDDSDYDCYDDDDCYDGDDYYSMEAQIRKWYKKHHRAEHTRRRYSKPFIPRNRKQRKRMKRANYHGLSLYSKKTMAIAASLYPFADLPF